MSNISNYSGVSNKTDACQMVAQMSEEDHQHFCGLFKEAKVALLCELWQAETGSLWSGLETSVPGENSEEILVEGELAGQSSVGGEKRLAEPQASSACTCPQNLEREPLVMDPLSGAFTFCLLDAGLPDFDSMPLLQLGDKGFSISQFYVGMDIIP